jgi:hypothetical protein
MSTESEGAARGGPPQGRGGPEPLRLVSWSGLVLEPLAGFFQRHTPWTWRRMRAWVSQCGQNELSLAGSSADSFRRSMEA